MRKLDLSRDRHPQRRGSLEGRGRSQPAPRRAAAGTRGWTPYAHYHLVLISAAQFTPVVAHIHMTNNDLFSDLTLHKYIVSLQIGKGCGSETDISTYKIKKYIQMSFTLNKESLVTRLSAFDMGQCAQLHTATGAGKFAARCRHLPCKVAGGRPPPSHWCCTSTRPSRGQSSPSCSCWPCRRRT